MSSWTLLKQHVYWFFYFFWLNWCYNHHLKKILLFFQNWVQRSVKMFFLGRYGDTFTVWNSPFESKENSCLFIVLSLYLFWFARGVFSLSPFMKQVLRMGNLISFLCSNLQGRLSFALYWFKISKTNSILADEKGGEYQIDILMCCRHVLRTQNLHKIVVGLSEILNRNWNTSRTSLHLLGSIKEVLYIIMCS